MLIDLRLLQEVLQRIRAEIRFPRPEEAMRLPATILLRIVPEESVIREISMQEEAGERLLRNRREVVLRTMRQDHNQRKTDLIIRPVRIRDLQVRAPEPVRQTQELQEAQLLHELILRRADQALRR